MWYYETNRQVQGPITQIELLQLVNRGRLSTQTLIWKEGLSTWIKITETGLVPQNEEVITPPPYDPDEENTHDPLILKRLNTNKWLFLFFIVGCVLTLFMLAGFPLFFSMAMNQNKAGIIFASLISQFFGIGSNVAVVLQYILLFNFWKQVQDGHVRTTPGKAIGFLFIPFFNFYWAFIAYWGLAKELKRFISAHFEKTSGEEIRKPKEYLSFLLSLGPTLYIVFLVSFMLIFTSIMPTQSPEVIQQDPQRYLLSFFYPIIAVGGLSVILRMIVMSDLYLTVRSILKAN